ncbi:hypothetical protein JK151_06760 [Ralstonia syzygii subsp. celebesensis]|uniref:hypothetical protein n=1 Tax=Ralstonia syzygii TaxID=28097 RepID=UPI00191DFBA9|nr:hypothetical protein [Ralstonia syzygii]QQV57129.1 hypothetical protein JK151_06760 [Ralstonia syzygii subsp. celebesensis]
MSKNLGSCNQLNRKNEKNQQQFQQHIDHDAEPGGGNSIGPLDAAIANLQQQRREATKRNPALALFAPRIKNTEKLLEQASALSADRQRGATHNDSLPDSDTLIAAMDALANSWMKA